MVYDTANPLFVERYKLYAAHRQVGETGSSYIARVKVLGDLAKLSSMDEHEHVKIKVLKDLPAEVREKVLNKPDMSLEAMTKLVAESEAMVVINSSLRSELNKVIQGRQRKNPCRW